MTLDVTLGTKFMIKRTHKDHIRELLKTNSHWNTLDLGGGRFSWEEAQTVTDLVDHSELYPQKRFVKCNLETGIPFEDQEFDFTIASHITEHIKNIDGFLNEMMRISKRGYIEVPLPLFDNLTYGNTGPHIWWIRFDDVNNEVTFTPKAVVVRERIWPGPMNDQLTLFFRESMCLELYWEDDIKWRMEKLPANVNPDNKYDIWPVPHPDTARQ